MLYLIHMAPQIKRKRILLMYERLNSRKLELKDHVVKGVKNMSAALSMQSRRKYPTDAFLRPSI